MILHVYYIDLTSIDASILKADDCSVITPNNDVVRFTLHEDGKIVIHSGVKISTQNGEGPIIAELSASVDFFQGMFKMADLAAISPPSAFTSLSL